MLKKYNLDIIRLEGFPPLHNENNINKIMVDDKSALYVTIDKYFKIILYLIDSYLKKSHKKKFSLLDGFAGIGSDTISFMLHNQYFYPIVSIELDSNRFNMLKNNINLYQNDYNLSSNINILHNCNILDFIKLNVNYDIVYLDPPWGDDYLKNEYTEIFINNIKLEEIINQIIDKKIFNDLIVVKLPKNYNLNSLKLIKASYSVYEILKNDKHVYLNLLIISKKNNEKYIGWNFKKIIYNHF